MQGESPGWSTLLGIGTVSAVAVAAGIALGWWADALLNTFPILLFVGLALGIVGGVYYTVSQIRPFLKD
jgi:F0F1-type ATP synthase assembly protein I